MDRVVYMCPFEYSLNLRKPPGTASLLWRAGDRQPKDFRRVLRVGRNERQQRPRSRIRRRSSLLPIPYRSYRYAQEGSEGLLCHVEGTAQVDGDWHQDVAVQRSVRILTVLPGMPADIFLRRGVEACLIHVGRRSQDAL